MKIRPFEIVYEDKDILVINKMAGILSVPDRYNHDKPNLYSMLTHYKGSVFPLHRLDKGTSGVMIYAKTEESHKALSEQFESRSIIKKYLTIVTGIMPEKSGEIKTFLAPAMHGKEMMVVAKKGKLSITQFSVLEEFLQYSLLQITILTGRQHQIRVHMQHIGHPLAVDSRYGGREALYAHDIKLKHFQHKKNEDPKPLISRCTLHAASLTFTHPENNEIMEVNAELPKDMNAVINQLRKWQSKTV